MKKLLIAIPLVVGASWAGASYYAGTQTQSGYDQLLAQLNEFKPFTLVNEQYYAGVANSTAITKVMDSTADDATVLFRLHHAINHSPIGLDDNGVRVAAATIVTTLVKDEALPAELLAAIENGFTDAEPLLLNTKVGFDGASVHQLLISPYQRQYDEINVMFDGIDYTSTIKGDSFVGAGTIGKVSVTDDQQEMTLSAGAINTDLTRISQAVFTGTYGIGFDSFSFAGDNLPFTIDLKEIGVMSDTHVTDGLLGSKAAFSVGEINTPMPINSAGIEFSVNGISTTGMEETMDKISKIPMLDMVELSDTDVIMAVLESYKPLIGPEASIEYGFNVSNDGGDAELSYGISVADAASPNYPTGGFDSVSTVRDVLNMIKFEAHFKADVAAIDQTPLAMFMGAPQAQEYILSDGVNYTTDVTVSDLIVDINGNPMSLELMVGEMLDMSFADVLDM